MRYDIRLTGKRNIDGIIVTHNDETIVFSGVQKVNGGNADQELFEFINEFFEGCQPEKLDALWELLKQGKRILDPGYFDEVDTPELNLLRDNNMDYTFITRHLEPIINKIYLAMPTYDISYAAVVTGRCEPPSDLMLMSSMGDYPEETTIDDRKYRELVKLAFATQVCFPIINQLLEHVLPTAGKEYRDAVAGGMIANVSALTTMEGWNILDTYVRASCLRQEARRSNIGVFSEAKYIDFIVYKGLFNKLCLTFLPSKINGKNLSKELNSLVEGEIRGGSDVKYKSFKDGTPGSDEQSIPESYRITQVVNGTDEIAQAEYFSFGMYESIELITEDGEPKVINHRRTKGFFEHQCIGLGIKNQELAEKLFLTLPKVGRFRLNPIHTKILQLTFIKDINYYLVPVLNYEQLMAAICLAQVKLFELGFEHLATLCGIIRNENYAPSYLEDDFKLNNRDRETLVEMCDIYTGQNITSTENILVKSVSDFLDDLSTSGWDSNIEPGLLGNKVYVDAMSPGQMYQVDLVPAMKHELIELIKHSNTVDEGLVE